MSVSAACCCHGQVVLTPKRVQELQTWVAFHRKHESLDMPLDMGTSLPLECATIEDVSFFAAMWLVCQAWRFDGVLFVETRPEGRERSYFQPRDWCWASWSYKRYLNDPFRLVTCEGHA